MENYDSLFNTYIPSSHISSHDTVECLINNNVSSLARERLEVSFGSDIKAIELTVLLIYFCECQYLNAPNSKYEDYFVVDLWTIMHKTHFKNNLVNELKKRLQDMGILNVKRDRSYQASCRYKIDFDVLEAYLNSMEEEYVAYFHDQIEHDIECKEIKERVIEENKRKNIRKKYGKTNVWENIYRHYNNTDVFNFFNDGLTTTEMWMYKAFNYGSKLYQHKDFKGGYHFYNEVMLELSGYSYYEAKEECIKNGPHYDEVGNEIALYKVIDEFREGQIRQNSTLQTIVEAFAYYPEDPTGTLTEATKFIIGHRKAFFKRYKSKNETPKFWNNDFGWCPEMQK